MTCKHIYRTPDGFDDMIWNPLCIIVPCHRVIGSNKSITGYGGGIKNKIALLRLEKHDISNFIIPTKGTAL